MIFKKYLFILILIFLIIGTIIFMPNNKDDIIINNYENITLGYCPTMKSYADNYKADKKIEFQSSNEALKALENNDVNLVIIGRVAEKKETTKEGIFLEDEGYTLISNKKEMVLFSDLQDVEIYTYISQEITLHKFPELKNIIYLEDKKEALNKNIVLIDWKDWDDNYNLLIPIKNDFTKIEKFRIPVIYKQENLNIDDLKI